ncbi:MAG: hypothetical protein EA391_07935 [Balneolaceae bacterium]|nr:MAG: hypothetical protein EA391_07935 [Balneolaceae bacterium]
MKRFTLFFLILSAFPFISPAQQTETLISGEVHHGGFGALLFGVTSINSEMVYLRGSRAAWAITFREGHTLNIGLGNYRTDSGFDATGWQVPNIDTPEMRMNYGGFELEYLNRSYKLVHYGIQATVGGGDVRYRDRNIELDRTADSFFSLQPGANIHLNVTGWFRVSGGVYYRYVNNVNLEGTGNSDLSGFSAVLALRFGWFP